jgi:hypothetical protein
MAKKHREISSLAVMKSSQLYAHRVLILVSHLFVPTPSLRILFLMEAESNFNFGETIMNSGRFGSLLTSFTGPDETKIYLGAAMETAGGK